MLRIRRPDIKKPVRQANRTYDKTVHEHSEENLKRIIQIEGEVYPVALQTMQYFSDWDDLAGYCECSQEELKVWVTDDFYCLLAVHPDYVEFVDLCSKVKNTPLLRVVDWALKYNRPFIMDCRETTSYRMILALEKAGKIEIEKDRPYTKGGEPFHDLKIIPKMTVKDDEHSMTPSLGR